LAQNKQAVAGKTPEQWSTEEMQGRSLGRSSQAHWQDGTAEWSRHSYSSAGTCIMTSYSRKRLDTCTKELLQHVHTYTRITTHRKVHEFEHGASRYTWSCREIRRIEAEHRPTVGEQEWQQWNTWLGLWTSELAAQGHGGQDPVLGRHKTDGSGARGGRHGVLTDWELGTGHQMKEQMAESCMNEQELEERQASQKGHNKANRPKHAGDEQRIRLR
jgi:hypothetical protein